MTYEIQIQADNKVINVILDADIEKDEGIGSYEFWGSREYDSGSGELFVADLNWEKHKYSKEENEIIEKYVDENSEEIENKIIKLCNQIY